MRAAILSGAGILLLAASAHALPWVNELHYDNSGTDTGEGFEIAGAAGTDLSGYSVVLYNGSSDVVYDTVALTGAIDDEGAGFGALWFALPTNGIQNGSPDGLALVDPSSAVLSFLSYEGTFTALDGPAMGLSSTDIGVSEMSGTPIGDSLQLAGTGTQAADFSWTGPLSGSPGSLNAGQSIPEPATALLLACGLVGLGLARRPGPPRPPHGRKGDRTMRRALVRLVATTVCGTALLASPALAHFKKCPKDSIQAGSICMDTYEASAWRVPNPTQRNKSLVKKIQKGAIKDAADLIAKGATQLGVPGDDFAPCGDTGTDCTDVFAVSLPGVKPSAWVTWFQAQQACANSGKRLPTSAEWQQAVVGTPDTDIDNGTTDCNKQSAGTVDTGSRARCVSTFGAYDMVGNLHEWVADWVPRSTAIPGWGPLSNDYNSFAGASTVATSPAALLRGGHFQNNALHAGPLTIDAGVGPTGAQVRHGFRCTR